MSDTAPSPKPVYGCCIDGECTDETCMALPDCSTCGDCRHIGRCIAFGYTRSREAESCDFFPRRFAARGGR